MGASKNISFFALMIKRSSFNINILNIKIETISKLSLYQLLNLIEVEFILKLCIAIGRVE